MPRLKPAPGYVTSKEAAEMLDISDATLSTYVKNGWLKRYGPPARKHKFYKESEIRALIASRNTFDEYEDVDKLAEAMEQFVETYSPSDLQKKSATERLRKAFERAQRLSEAEQNTLAAIIEAMIEEQEKGKG